MNKRKMTSIALVAAVAISTVQLAYPADVFAHEQVNKTRIENVREVEKSSFLVKKNSNNISISSESELNGALEKASTVENNPTVISLEKSIALTKPIEVKEGTYVKINGNGNSIYREDKYINANPESAISLIVINGVLDTENITLDAKCNENTNGFRVIAVNGIYNMYENTTIQNGYLTDGGGANVLIASENGIFNMYAGVITNGHGKNSGGVFVYGNDKGGTFNMYGGEISNNVGTSYGSAVVVYSSNGQKANLYGGKIINNTSTSTTMGSDFYGGALYINAQESTYISGDVEMYGNKTKYKDKNEYENVDIYCSFSKNDNHPNITSKLNYKLNIYKQEDKSYSNNAILAKGSNKRDYEYTLTNEDLSMINTFSIMDKTYAIILDEEENVIKHVEGVNVTFKKNDGTEESYTKAVEKGKEVFIPSNEFTREGYVFVGWSDTAEGTVIEENKITVSNNDKILYAKWAKVNDYTIEYGKEGTTIVLGNDGETVDNVSISDYKVDPKYSDIITVDDKGKITTKGVGEAEVSYSVKLKNGEVKTVISKVKVTKPAGTVAMVDKIPYKNLQDAVNSNNNTKIKVVADVVLNTSLDLSKMKSRTIDFGNHKITKSATFTEKETSLIKIEGNNEKITISNAKFDTSNKNELDAIRVVGDKINHPNIVVENIEVNNAGNNKGSAIYVENASVEIRGDASVTGNTSNHTVVEIQGKDSLVVLDENSTINKNKTPDIGNNHSDDVIMGNKTDSNDFINGNNTGGGSVPSIPSTPSKPSKPVYTHKEVIGANRYETAAKVADELGSYDNVVLVNATSTMSDGLAASGLAGKENGAILLTKKDSIPKATMDRIKKVKKVYIIGGENAISQKVANQITAANIKVERIGGKNRVETSELVAEKLGNYSNAFIVNGFKGEADAMSASAIAARYEAPILLTNGKTSTHAKKSGVEYYVVGGTSVVNKSIADKYNAERLAGKDRYATNREVIDEFYSGSDKLYLANGETLVDALTASTIAKNHGIVLVNKKSDNSVLKDKNTVQIGGMDFEIDFDK